jgi:uncharacterized protein GlcG (DUF336 family)
MTALTLDLAVKIAERALAKGRELKLNPLAIAVLDIRGQIKACHAEDNATLMRAEIAIGKAWGSLVMGFGGREQARRAQAMPTFLTALQVLAGGRVVPFPGGVLLRDTDGSLLGAVGVSGDKADNDELCAVAGIASVGLKSDTGDPA